MQATISLSHHDWSLHRKGPIDQLRHNEKVKEAIKENLPAIIGEESIIATDGAKIVKIPIRSLELPHFRFGRADRDRVGQGKGDSKVGDVLGQEGSGPGRGTGAGNQPGIDYYEAELTIDELTAMVFEDLALPFLKPKAQREVVADTVHFTEVRKRGIFSNLDKRRTLLENFRRNARAGNLAIGGISNEDLRFKTWEPEIRREQNAVVIAMRDVSGSMGEFEKYITRSFYLWMVRFLRSKYQSVEIVFVTHHSEAKEVDEETFFHLGESGGTKVSSAYQLALEIVSERYPVDAWNVYPFHFSDGDNWGDGDSARCVGLVRQLLDRCNAFGYGEIQQQVQASPTTLMAALSAIHDPRFIALTISRKEDVHPALRRFFAARDPAEVAV
jgi:sporulation protein YhbH